VVVSLLGEMRRQAQSPRRRPVRFTSNQFQYTRLHVCQVEPAHQDHQQRRPSPHRHRRDGAFDVRVHAKGQRGRSPSPGRPLPYHLHLHPGQHNPASIRRLLTRSWGGGGAQRRPAISATDVPLERDDRLTRRKLRASRSRYGRGGGRGRSGRDAGLAQVHGHPCRVGDRLQQFEVG